VSFYSTTKPLPSVSTVWGDSVAPLNQTRERTRNDIRRILGLAGTADALAMLTAAMNGAASLSPEIVEEVEALVAAWKVCDADRATAQTAAPWEGAAPLKKADVLEYDTSLMAGPDWAATRTAGLTARMDAIRACVRASLGIDGGGTAGKGSGVVPLLRS
jgi:hypothetical protein